MQACATSHMIFVGEEAFRHDAFARIIVGGLHAPVKR
jgi:hypothetical protein